MAVSSTRTGNNSLVGAAPRGYAPAYGGVPQVPSLIDVYGQATGANARMLPTFTTMGSGITAASEESLLNNLRMALPGYDTSVGKSMSNIGSLQRGEIPTDVSNLLKQQAAERGIATGLYSSPNSNAALMSALGQTSLGLQNEGEKQMTALVGRTPQAQPFDVSRLFMNPSDLYESQLLANIYAAAPVPRAAAQQLISDQMGGYEAGRKNVPSFSSGAPSAGAPYVPISRPDIMNPPAVGALGPFAPAPAPYKPVTGSLQAGGGNTAGLEWDPEMGTYYNRFTGQYVPPDEGSPGWLTWGGANSGGDFTGSSEPMSEEDFYSFAD